MRAGRRCDIRRRELLLGISILAAASVLPQHASVAAALAGPFPPKPPRIPKRIEQLGRSRVDHYAWMKYVPPSGVRSAETLLPAVRSHLEAENEYAEAILRPVQPLADDFLPQMAARLPPEEQAPPVVRGDWEYYSYFRRDASHPVHARRRLGGGREEVLLDEQERAAGHAYFRSTDHAPSPDHRYFVWGEDLEGSDRYRICVRDLGTGEIRILVPSDAAGYGGIVVSPSARHLFWIRRDARGRPTRVYRTPVGGGDHALVYEEKDPAIFIQLGRGSAASFVAINLSGPDTSETWLVSASDETAAPRLIAARRSGVRYTVDEWDGRLLLVHTDQGAFDGRIMLAPFDRPEVAETLVPHRPGVQIVAIHPFRDTLVRVERRDGLLRLVLTQRGSPRETPVAFDEPAYALVVPDGQDAQRNVVRVAYESPRTPRRWLDIELATGKQRLVQADRIPGFARGDYELRRLTAPAPDGEQVPITVLMRKGTPLDGSAPLLLYGYGAYGVSIDPDFSIPALALVDRGWIYAIAHVRGGSEKGRRWFLDGRRFAKRNSFVDFIAAAEQLSAQRYTHRGRIVAYGRSAGGLLVGASANMAPDLWAGVIAEVPFVDMLNTMSDANHPLVPLFRPDWGDPLADPQAYDYIASISPYENVRPQHYPPVLATAGIKDDRVSYWEPAKWVAAIRAESTSGAPALMRTDMAAGHQKSGGRLDLMREYARLWSFAQLCIDQAASWRR